MGMNVVIDGVEFPTRKIMGIADIWQKSWKSFTEFFDAACREVTVTYIVNKMAHRLIGWGHHEKRCLLYQPCLSSHLKKCGLLTKVGVQLHLSYVHLCMRQVK